MSRRHCVQDKMPRWLALRNLSFEFWDISSLFLVIVALFVAWMLVYLGFFISFISFVSLISFLAVFLVSDGTAYRPKITDP